MDKIKLSIVKALFYVLAYTPLWLLHGMGTVLGTLVFCLPIKARYYAGRNIEICFPKLSFWRRQYLLWCALQESSKGLLEEPLFFVRSKKHLLKLVKNHDALDAVRADVADGKGAIVLGMHLGGYYLKNAIIAHYMPATTYLYKPQKGIIGKILDSLRNRFGGNLVTTTREGIMAMYRHLKKGGCVGMICDHNVLDNGNAWVPFFGLPVPAMTLAGKLAAKTKVPVYMAIMERLSWARGYKLHVWPVDPKIYDADVAVATRAMLVEVEKSIEMFPAQNEWLYRRFWDRPEGTEPRYKTQLKQ